MAVLSLPKLKTVDSTCTQYAHCWTDSCVRGSFGLFLHASQYTLKTYASVYLLTFLMKGKKPTIEDIKKTLYGIVRSSAFLTTNSFGFSASVCFLRWLFGGFNIYTAAYAPAWLCSFIAIHVERKSRRPMLCLYVMNVATETLFRMAESRGLVKSIKNGQVIIFSLSAAAMVYLLRSDSTVKDSSFSIFRYLVGSSEAAKTPENSDGSVSDGKKGLGILDQGFIGQLKGLKRSDCCPHAHSCLYNALEGLGKILVLGYGGQVALRLLFSLRKIVNEPSRVREAFFGSKVLNLGAFLGLFSGIYRGASCALRWSRKKDSEFHAIPASLLAGSSFWFYPDTTAALYIMWKALQLFYIKLMKAGYLPNVPMATVLLYSSSTALLFYAALVEPKNLRPSYFKFLFGLSGCRISTMDRLVLDKLREGVSKDHNEVLQALKLTPIWHHRF